MDRITLDLLASYAKMKGDTQLIASPNGTIIRIERFNPFAESLKENDPLTIVK